MGPNIPRFACDCSIAAIVKDVDVARARSAGAVTAVTRALYGAELGAVEGVLHVVAVTRDGEALRVIRVGPRAPKSDVDRFALNLARARVDGIVVSGAVLRAEPGLRYDLDGPGDSAEGLAAWRREVAGRKDPPWLLVLTRSGDLRADHPVWDSWASPIVYTGRDVATSLRRRLPERVAIEAREETSARDAIAHLRDERGCAGVSIEAGPRVAAPLYDPPLAIDELMLSVFEGALDPRAAGPVWLEEADLEARLRPTAPPVRVEEPSGPWTFSRWRRARE